MTKRIISLLLCLVMVFGIVPAEAIATYIPEQEDSIITPIGDIDGVPILNEEDAIKLTEEQQEYTGPETEEEFVNLLLSDSEEAKAYFGESEEPAYYTGAEYWANLPQYKMTDGQNNEIGPGQNYNSYCIVTESGETYPIFRWGPDDKGRKKMYYLYCLYKTGVFQNENGGEFRTDGEVLAFDFIYFYCTIPYVEENVQGWTDVCNGHYEEGKWYNYGKPNAYWVRQKVEDPEFGPNGLPIPSSICDTRGLRTYDRDNLRFGGWKTYSTGQTVFYCGQEEVWFTYDSGSGTDSYTWENTYKNYQNPGKFEYPDKKDAKTMNTSIKNAVSISSYDEASGFVSVPSEFPGINPKGGTTRLAIKQDPLAFLQINGVYSVPRQNVNGAVQSKISTTSAGGFSNDTYFSPGWGGFYNTSKIYWMPWWSSQGEIGGAWRNNPPAKYQGTVNEQFIVLNKSRQNQTNDLTSNIVKMDVGSVLYQLWEAGALKFVWIGKEQKQKIYQGYLKLFGGNEDKLNKELEGAYGTSWETAKKTFNEDGYYLYLDKDFAMPEGMEEDEYKRLQNKVNGIYGIVYGMESAFGYGGMQPNKYIYPPTGENSNKPAGAWQQLITGQGISTSIMKMNLQLNKNFDYKGQTKDENGTIKFKFFPCPLMAYVEGFDLTGLTDEQIEAIYGANTLGKFFTIMLYMSVSNYMGDPETPVMEDNVWPLTSPFVTTRGSYYSSNSLPRTFTGGDTPSKGYPLPTVTKDLVVADTEENPIYEELEGKYEKEYMGSNLAR